ncbi:MAG: hypothetical protein HY917_02015 [Candidatus Diapherotrites archaeon]|nr:hypothetical protein [Candidatus Diapherotrites archaeon]
MPKRPRPKPNKPRPAEPKKPTLPDLFHRFKSETDHVEREKIIQKIRAMDRALGKKSVLEEFAQIATQPAAKKKIGPFYFSNLKRLIKEAGMLEQHHERIREALADPQTSQQILGLLYTRYLLENYEKLKDLILSRAMPGRAKA